MILRPSQFLLYLLLLEHVVSLGLFFDITKLSYYLNITVTISVNESHTISQGVYWNSLLGCLGLVFVRCLSPSLRGSVLDI
jgi:hypothetical protein